MSTPIRRIIAGALHGKTIGRILTNDIVHARCAELAGRVLDLAGGESPSYLPLLPTPLELVRTDRLASPGVVAVDINERLPFPDASFDAVLIFAALYIAKDPQALVREVARVLKPGGIWHASCPFIANEMPEPEDYWRFTAAGLERLATQAGFVDIQVERVGERASAAMQLLHPYFLFNWVRALAYVLARGLDALLPAAIRAEHPTPIVYFLTARRP